MEYSNKIQYKTEFMVLKALLDQLQNWYNILDM